MAHMPASYLEEGGVGEEEEEEDEGLSLWSCIKNGLRRKKCTCHLNNIVLGKLCVISSPRRVTVSSASLASAFLFYFRMVQNFSQ